MAVLNVHERLLPAKPSEVGALIDALATADDPLWPRADWPPMELDRGLAPGSRGGHGPVRYTVAAHAPQQWVRFTFTGPRGFDGFHEYSVHPVDGDDGSAVLRHTLAMRARGAARLTWPLAFRSFHDACLEDSLDRAESALTGTVARPARWSPYVRFLRRITPG
ncbi:SRPBCC family protein [Streptomyces sp. NPDC059063]|uniref:SRPBCC family protein n=1 Tax=unclassified Streptomyces TaxID=2593676 RepID=UPI00369669A4